MIGGEQVQASPVSAGSISPFRPGMNVFVRKVRCPEPINAWLNKWTGQARGILNKLVLLICNSILPMNVR
jgi:hypothetical protein